MSGAPGPGAAGRDARRVAGPQRGGGGAGQGRGGAAGAQGFSRIRFSHASNNQKPCSSNVERFVESRDV